MVVTRRILDEAGNPVGSPYPYINHNSQTEALSYLEPVLPDGLALDDIAYAFTYTTQSVQSHFQAVRDGLYGYGVQSHLSEEFPAEVDGLMELRDPAVFPDMDNPYIIWSEQWLDAFSSLYIDMFGQDPEEREFELFLEGHRYIDYQVIGYFDSPQLFEREGDDGQWLPLDEQSWPPDLDLVSAPARSERVYFTLTVPRKEVSVRGNGEPAPVVIIGHGYGGNRFNGMEVSGSFARHGLATLSIDNVSHGLSVSEEEESLATTLLTLEGLGPYAEATFSDRAYDQNNDGRIDSGADFWTSYLFHTRDVVRQSALDYMQLIRIFRTFDGEKTWSFDTGGATTIAGDFDGDGVVDVGGDASITMTGGSLGGMMSMLMGGIEPELDAIAPLIGGGGLGDLGIRSTQSGVREAFILRPMGPLYVGTIDDKTGAMSLEMIIPDINDTPGDLLFASVPDVEPGDSMVVANLTNGERGCGHVDAEGRVRVITESDPGDDLEVTLYIGDALVAGSQECAVVDDAIARAVVNTFEVQVEFQGEFTTAGSPLVAMSDGLALGRGDPGFRRFQGLGQLILDPGDPAVYARHTLEDPLTYAGTGTSTGTHVLQLTSIGDMAVPVAGGMTYARAVGLLEYQEVDPTYGVPDNQLLINTFTAEGVTVTKRYTDSTGEGVLIDVDNFSEGQDLWGEEGPRLDPPLRIGIGQTDALGGQSASLFMYPKTTGQHGPNSPGWCIDKLRGDCLAACEAAGTKTESEDCGCAEQTIFDDGQFFYNMAALYLVSGGQEIRTDTCMAFGDCEDFMDVPGRRLSPDTSDETGDW